eukprot:6490028-Amphidinium_carterae.1
MLYHVDDDGAWRVNGREMVPMDASATPRLCCRLCNATAMWTHKAFLCQRNCPGVVTIAAFGVPMVPISTLHTLPRSTQHVLSAAALAARLLPLLSFGACAYL